MDDPVLCTAQCVMQMVLSNEPWQDLGYVKRPKRGLLAAWFMPRWKIDLEDAIFVQVIASLSASYLLAGIIANDQLTDLIEVYVNGPIGGMDLYKSIGFASAAEARAVLRETIVEYCSTPGRDWHGVLLKRARVAFIPDKAFAARLVVGAIRFTELACSMRGELQRRAAQGRW